ncbi:hypothetical protein [Vibrio jasicida]|uniref:hypothetical protein n=1 Tax=Vibrio jasicida TaxID=766224 RepID=UPI0005EEC475|nr:hypothetical protein [Vibrio jasicida]
MSFSSIVGQLSKASPLYSLLAAMYEKITDRSSANEVYSELVPAMHDLLTAGYRYESPEIQAIVNVLRELPAWGVKRINFEKTFLRDEYGLRKLPRDPRTLNGMGYWH